MFGYDLVGFPAAGSLGAHLASLFAELGINCVLDVGAHVSEYALFLREIGYRGRIVSFEPVLASFERLERLTAGDGRWSASRVALGREEGVKSMNVTCATEFSSFLTPNRDGRQWFVQGSGVHRVEPVEVRRLESVFPACVAAIEQPRVYLKIDTQGCELEVLEGAGRHLEEILGLQAELPVQPMYGGMTPYTEALRRMGRMGFAPTGLFAVSRDRDLQLIEVDCVMRRKRPRRQGE